MNTEPISYDSLKTVLKYVEANKRFELLHHAPSITFAEKAAPLTIAELSFRGTSFTVNSTEYKFGIIRKHTDDQTPERIKSANDFGGVQYDLDQFGIEDLRTENILTDGDVLIEDIGREEQNEEVALVENVTIQDLEFDIRNLQARLDRKLNENGNERNMKIDHMRTLIGNYESLLLPLICQRDNVNYPLQMFIQLTITTPQQKKTQRWRYNRSIHEALKQLIDKFFGNRRQIVNVKCLSISGGVTLRLPTDLKIRIQKIRTSKEVSRISDGLVDVIVDSSYPLNCLEFEDDVKVIMNSDHHAIKNARTLILSSFDRDATWIESVQNITSKNIFLRSNQSQFSAENFLPLIETWVEENREIGTSFSISITNKQSGIELLNEIKNQFNDAYIKRRCCYVSINHLSEIRISYGPIANAGEFTSQWALKMKIIAII